MQLIKSTPSSLEGMLGSIIELVNQGQLELAWALCRRAETAYPAQPAVQQMLAVLSLQRGEPQQANGYATASLVLRPNHVPTLVVAGDAARLVGEIGRAVTYYSQAHALQPDRPDICLALGVSQYQCGQLQSASLTLERCVRLAPTLVDGWFNLALVRQDLRDLDGAISALQSLLHLAPERVDALVNLGIALQASARMDDAIGAYSRAYGLQKNSFGPIASALSTESTGRIWLNLDDLRAQLQGASA
jgi:tetratricopeptide (TPR) repeat protein